MKEYVKIAWRNLWRNRKRTAITTASILFAVFFALLMRSMALGSYDNMIKNAVERYSGFIQIQHIDFKDDPGLDNSLLYTDTMIEKLDKISGIKAVVPRVESFALASFGTQTKGVMVLGVDVEREKNLSQPEIWLVKYRITSEGITQLKEMEQFPEDLLSQLQNLINHSYSNLPALKLELDIDDSMLGKYLPLMEKVFHFEGNGLEANDDGILVSDRLAKFLKLQVGDTLILMGQGYHSVSAAGLFPVRGIVKMPSPELDNKLLYMTLSAVQHFFSLEKQATSIAINLHNNSDENLKKKQEQIGTLIQDTLLTVKNWKEFNQVLYQQIESDNQSGKAMLGLLYFIIFFGIFGTVLMMVYERYREFGVLISIGMQKLKLIMVLVIELAFMGFMGVLAGIGLSLPFLYLGNRYPYRFTGDLATMMESYGMEPVMPLKWIDDYIWWQGVVVGIMVILAGIYPLFKVSRLKESVALRS
jgi:ABC-type lipoprotein release transport system permease subunit